MKSSLFARRAHLRPSLSVRSLAASATLLLAIVLLAGNAMPVSAAGDTAATPFWLTGDEISIFDNANIAGNDVVSVVSTSGAPDSTVNVAIQVAAAGGETAISFSLQFDQTKLSISGISGSNNNPDVTNGTGAPFGTRTVNANQVASGRIGVLQSFNIALVPGVNQILVFRFRILPGAAPGSTAISFGDTPALRSLTNQLAEDLEATWSPGTITITAPAPGSLQFSSSSVTVAEAGPNATFTVTRTGGSSGAVSVQYATAGQTATGGASCTAGVDYVTAAGTLSFAAGETAKTISVPICNDTADEPNETAVITLSNPTGGASLGSPAAAALTITDDDLPPTVSVTVSPLSVSEDSSANLVYTFTRSESTGSLSVNFSAGGTAANGSDHTLTAASFNGTTGAVNFTNGSAIATVTVDPSADAAVEADETVVLTVTSGTGYTVGNPNSASGTITNDDVLPTVTVSASPATVPEDDAGNLTFAFARTGPTTTPLTVTFTVAGTAAAATDYSCVAGAGASAVSCLAASGQVTFGAGMSTAQVLVDPTADAQVESDETVLLSVSSGAAYQTGNPASASGTITNDDLTPTVTVTSSTPSVAEDGSANMIYTFARTGPVTSALTAAFSIGGTASATTDYSCAAGAGASGVSCSTTVGQITFSAGAATAQVVVDPTPDAQVEADETVALAVTPGAGYSAGAPSSATGTIANDDVTPVVTVSVSPSSVLEDGAAALVYSFTRTGATADTQAVSFTIGGTALAGTDHSCLPGNGVTALTCSSGSGQFTFGAGIATAMVLIDPTADLTVEGDETAVVTVASGSGYSPGNPASATGTISNDDVTPTVTISVAPTSVAEDGGTNLVYTFTRSVSGAAAIVVNYANSGTAARGTDYSCQPDCAAGQVTIPAGQASTQLVVDPVADALAEGNESVIVSLGAGNGYSVAQPASATGIIEEVTGPGFEADLAARPLGDGSLRANDVEAARAIISGDPVNPATNEFQRADVAPYETQGDGSLRANDLQMVKNYVATLVAPQPANGPAAALARPAFESLLEDAVGRTARITSAKTTRDGRVGITIEVEGLGDEVVALLGLRFDNSRLTDPVVQLGETVADDAVLTTRTAEGQLSMLIDSSSALSGSVATITFNIAMDGPAGSALITFDSSASFSDKMGNLLNAAYKDGSVLISQRSRK